MTFAAYRRFFDRFLTILLIALAGRTICDLLLGAVPHGLVAFPVLAALPFLDYWLDGPFRDGRG